MKKIAKIAGIIVAVMIVLFAAAAIFVSTLDADKYRPQLVSLLSEKTGRAVKLNGPIGLSLGLAGIKISIQDASIGNPSWASRPNLAGMGKFEVGVGIIPLLTHRLSINELSIENADILLETNAAGEHNWQFGPQAAASQPADKAAPVQTTTASGASLSIDKLTIINSQLAMRSADGKISSYNISNLSLGMAGIGGADISFKGDANGTPVTVTLKTGIKDLLSTAAFPFDADVNYGVIELTAKGNADLGNKKADISAYEIKAGKTSIKGNASAAWDGPRPVIRGALNSDRIDMADFKQDGDDAASTAPVKEQTASEKNADNHMFSMTPLPLEGLKAVNADLDIAVTDFPMGRGDLKDISAKLALANGNLNLAPVRATVGDQPIEMQVKLDASQSPAHLTMGIIGNGIDLGDLQKLGDMSPFMSGKAGANIQIAGEGDSAHAIASSLGGTIIITAEKGEILTGAASGISSSLGTLFNPQGGDAALNCLAARFIAKNGVLNDNGILIDSTPSTVSGKGNINLALETVNLTLRANTKLVDVGGLVPAVQINGTLKHPGYSVDAEGMVKNVVGGLMNGNLNIADSGVPVIQTPPTGQNACIYTLDHPKAASSGSSILPSDAAGKASQKIQNIGNSLKGLFGK